MFFREMVDCYGYVLLIGALLVVIGALYGVTYEKDPDAAILYAELKGVKNKCSEKI